MKRIPRLILSDAHRLEVPRLEHSDVLFRQINSNRNYLKQWLPWLDQAKKPVDSLQFLAQNKTFYETGKPFNFGIFYNEELVGMIGYISIDRPNRVAGIGYWLSEAATGNGLMIQSVMALCDYAYDREGMNRIYIRCATGNRGSRNIPERLCFHYEGTQRDAEWLYDHYVDLECYSMLERDWPGSEVVQEQIKARQSNK